MITYHLRNLYRLKLTRQTELQVSLGEHIPGKYLDKQSFKYLFQGLVRPHIHVEVLSPFKVGKIEKIENVQRRSTKQVPSLKNMSYKERLEKSKCQH